MKNVIKHNLNEDYLNSLSEKELTKEMQSWTPSEQVKHLCPEGVMPLEDFRRIGIQMIKDMEKVLNKGKVISVKGDELIAKTEELMRQVSPAERKRIEKMDQLINTQINKENRKDGIKNRVNNINFNEEHPSNIFFSKNESFNISKLFKDK